VKGELPFGVVRQEAIGSAGSGVFANRVPKLDFRSLLPVQGSLLRTQLRALDLKDPGVEGIVRIRSAARIGIWQRAGGYGVAEELGLFLRLR